MKLFENHSLKDITTMHLDVRCKLFAEYSTTEELSNLLNSTEYRQNRSMHIGGGSNLVFTRDYDGMLLHSQSRFISITDETADTVTIEAGAGMVWDDFVKYCIAHNYYGAENMSGIPGEVGASAVQNIGSYGAEVCEIISRVHCIEKATGKAITFTSDQCRYAYRDSIFKGEYFNRYIVTSVEYTLSKVPQFTLTYGPLKALGQKTDLTLQNVRETIIAVRNSKLPNPTETGSVGSFFKNPVIPENLFTALQSTYPAIPHYPAGNGLIKVPAGWLIENAGLKGYTVGGACVYPKQCLVIANTGNAAPDDIVALYKHIIATVADKYGIELHPEANII